MVPVLVSTKFTQARSSLARRCRILYEKGIKSELSCNEAHNTNYLILLVNNMLCSKLHCQKDFNLVLFSYAIDGRSSTRALGLMEHRSSNGGVFFGATNPLASRHPTQGMGLYPRFFDKQLSSAVGSDRLRERKWELTFDVYSPVNS